MGTASSSRKQDSSDQLPPQVRRAFAPIHKLAFGTAVGSAFGLVIFAVTMFEVARAEGHSPLALLGQYFAGYTVTPLGAFIGLFWGLVTGFVMGWFLAFSRNLVVAASIFWIRTRAELRATRDFLDHI
jgi:hypothetical protein